MSSGNQMQTDEFGPNHTLYVANISEKIKKLELKKALYSLFTPYGRVVHIRSGGPVRMRGQAFVVFDEVQCATKALVELQGTEFFGKELKLAYAQEKSDYIAKRDGTYKGKRAPAEEREKERIAKRKAVSRDEEMDDDAQPAAPRVSTRRAAPQPPNKILFVQQLPLDVSEGKLTAMFEQYHGFREVRLIPSKPGIAFVEFEDELASGQAMETLQGFKFTPNNAIAITFAKQ